jgi:hypothetical protein
MFERVTKALRGKTKVPRRGDGANGRRRRSEASANQTCGSSSCAATRANRSLPLVYEFVTLITRRGFAIQTFAVQPARGKLGSRGKEIVYDVLGYLRMYEGHVAPFTDQRPRRHWFQTTTWRNLLNTWIHLFYSAVVRQTYVLIPL